MLFPVSWSRFKMKVFYSPIITWPSRRTPIKSIDVQLSRVNEIFEWLACKSLKKTALISKYRIIVLDLSSFRRGIVAFGFKKWNMSWVSLSPKKETDKYFFATQSTTFFLKVPWTKTLNEIEIIKNYFSGKLY